MIEIPKECPSCSTTLYEENGQLFCPNNIDCPAQSQKAFEHFAKSAELKGFGPAVIEKLELQSIFDFFTLSYDDLLEATKSEKLSVKLFEELKKLHNLDIATFLTCLGISGLGKVRAKQLANVISSVREINNDTCRQAKLGEITTDSVMSYLADNPEVFDIKLKESKAEITNQIKATVCITGSLKDFKSRKEATEYLEKNGYKVASSVTKDVSILICEDESKINSSSYKKALEKNLTITTIFNLINEEAK